MRIKRTANSLRETHKNLHLMNIPHDCKEFEREIGRMETKEAIFNMPVSLFSYHRGMNN